MIWPFSFKKKSKNFLGVDVGTSTIKIVELSKEGNQKKLENYGFCSLSFFYEKLSRPEKDPLIFSPKELSKIILAILKEARIGSKNAFFSLPDFATFFTTISLPPMSKEEAEEAIKFEARKYVPLPLSEVTLDWLVINGGPDGEKKESLKTLLVAVPNDIINQYQMIAENSQLLLMSLEAEVFSLFRALMPEIKNSAVIIDIGAQSTTCNLVDKNILKISHSFDVGGNELTERISQTFHLNWQEAEELKKKQGLQKGELNTKTTLIPILGLMLNEVSKVSDIFYQTEGKEVETYILTGGSAFLPELKEYLFEHLKKEVKIAHPFVNLLYPPALEETLKELGPSFTIALGAAMKGLET